MCKDASVKVEPACFCELPLSRQGLAVRMREQMSETGTEQLV